MDTVAKKAELPPPKALRASERLLNKGALKKAEKSHVTKSDVKRKRKENLMQPGRITRGGWPKY